MGNIYNKSPVAVAVSGSTVLIPDNAYDGRFFLGRVALLPSS